MASSMESACTRLSTGPKISVLASWLAEGKSIEDGRREEITRLVAGDSGVAAVDDRFGAFADATEISDSTRCLLCWVMTGPIWTPASRPLPTRIVEAA